MSENKPAPVAWRDVDLDGMCEAFSRCIEAQHHKDSPFHSPINADAMTALRILRGLLPAMKALAAPALVAQQLTDAQIDKAARTLAAAMDYPWEYMPAKGRDEMRKHARAVIAAATGQEGGKNHG